MLTGPPVSGVWRTAEAIVWVTALVCLTYACVRYTERSVGSRKAIGEFAAMRSSATDGRGAAAVDLSLWSPQRQDAWRRALALPGPVVLAMLQIPRLHLHVPILEGTDDVTLDRGVGHIEDTAAPGEEGNSGIAGHRDGFFRGLKDTVVGDTIIVETLRDSRHYQIQRIWIVDPSDVWVLEPTPAASLTLVTCYPFYFIGSAPKRFIVRAVRVDNAHSLAD